MNRYNQIRAAMKRAISPFTNDVKWDGEFTLFSSEKAVSVGFFKYVLKDAPAKTDLTEIFGELVDFTKDNPKMLILLRCEDVNEQHMVIQGGAWFTIASEVASNVNGDVMRQNDLNYPLYVEFLMERASLAYSLAELGIADVTESIIPNNKLGVAYNQLNAIQMGNNNHYNQQGSN